MELTVIASGSKGNCYLLHNHEETLMIEAGVGMPKVLRSLSFNVRSLVGCLVTHEHKDHAKYARDVLTCGVPTYMTKGTAIAAKLDHPLLRTFEIHENGVTYEQVRIGGFTVRPFATEHDASEPCGFVISHKEAGNILFATDTHYLSPRFEGLNHIMIECNYDEMLLQKRDVPESLKERIRGSHMSIDTCIEMLRSNNLKEVYNIVLLHLSDGDGDPDDFCLRVQDATRRKTWVAKPGLTIFFDNTPF